VIETLIQHLERQTIDNMRKCGLEVTAITRLIVMPRSQQVMGLDEDLMRLVADAVVVDPSKSGKMTKEERKLHGRTYSLREGEVVWAVCSGKGHTTGRVHKKGFQPFISREDACAYAGFKAGSGVHLATNWYQLPTRDPLVSLPLHWSVVQYDLVQ